MPVIELPRYRRGDKVYFWDIKLKQLRNVDDPNDFIDVGMWGETITGNLEVYVSGEGWMQFTRGDILKA